VKRNRPQLLFLAGAAVTMASILWELTRMDPQTSYLVQPWSQRGFESIHGSIIFTIGALIALAGLATIWERSKEPTFSRIIAAGMGVGAIGLAAVYGTDDKTMGGGFLGWILAAVGGYVVKSAIKPYLSKLNLGSGSSETIKTVVKILASLAIFAVTTIVLYATLFGPERDALPVVWVTLAAALFVGLAVTGKPVELAANRMLIFSTVVGGWTIALSAAAMRTNLLEAQVELDGVVGQYKDTQITSGYFLALLGMLTAFVGATSLWAKRRDIIINQQRAERQRAAAIASAAEIQAALELAQQHQRDSRTKQSS
jgi:hypothetical protein